jgi:hypothetical protein
MKRAIAARMVCCADYPPGVVSMQETDLSDEAIAENTLLTSRRWQDDDSTE